MITSISNQKVKNVIALREHSKIRKKDKAFIAEGLRMFNETPDESIRNLYVTESFYKTSGLKSRIDSLNYELVSDEVFRKLSDTVTPQGVLMVVDTPEYSLGEIIAEDDAFLLVLEDIQDPGNLGTMLRTAEAAGITGIVMSRGTTDILSPKVIRSTMGAIYRMPFVYADIFEAMESMKKLGISIHAAALGRDTLYTNADYSGKTAIMIGNEGNGLSEKAINSATDIVTIPMSGQVESLNAAISAAVIMYEAKRQR